MARHYFTVAEVERLIPALERSFIRILQLRLALRSQEQTLERAGVPLSREILEADDPKESLAVRQAKALFRGYYETLSEEVATIGVLGGEVKDIEIGLVDFPGRRGTEGILLCWKFGEKGISHWHSPDSGYSGRRPIDDLVPRERSSVD